MSLRKSAVKIFMRWNKCCRINTCTDVSTKYYSHDTKYFSPEYKVFLSTDVEAKQLTSVVRDVLQIFIIIIASTNRTLLGIAPIRMEWGSPGRRQSMKWYFATIMKSFVLVKNHRHKYIKATLLVIIALLFICDPVLDVWMRCNNLCHINETATLR